MIKLNYIITTRDFSSFFFIDCFSSNNFIHNSVKDYHFLLGSTLLDQHDTMLSSIYTTIVWILMHQMWYFLLQRQVWLNKFYTYFFNFCGWYVTSKPSFLKFKDLSIFLVYLRPKINMLLFPSHLRVFRYTLLRRIFFFGDFPCKINILWFTSHSQ